jgi:flagellar FliJ protein
MAQAQLLAEQKREVVREAMKKVKVLEKLRETKLSQWKKERLDQEEKAMDDVVTAAFNER